MSDKTVQTLLDYFTNPVYQKHGPTDQEPAGSGPGGAAATNKMISGWKGKNNREIMTTIKGNRTSDQMGDVQGIYDAAMDAHATDYANRKQKSKEKFRYNMLSRPDDTQQDM